MSIKTILNKLNPFKPKVQPVPFRRGRAAIDTFSASAHGGATTVKPKAVPKLTNITVTRADGSVEEYDTNGRRIH